MSKGSAPKPQNYGPAEKAAAKTSAEATSSAKDEQKRAKQQFEHFQQQAQTDRGVSDQVVHSELNQAGAESGYSAADRALWEGTFIPQYQSLIDEANNYNSPGRRDLEMGRAESQVAQSAEKARQATLSNLESYGLNPAATRYAALDLNARTAAAAAEAQAGNDAARNVEQHGEELRTQALNIGAQLPGQSLNEGNAAVNASNAANSNQLATTQSDANTTGTSVQHAQVATGNYGAATGATNAQTNALSGQQAANDQAYQEKNATTNALIGAAGQIGGMAAGAATKAYLAKGGEAPQGVPTRPAFAGGVPAGASPSKGRALDDVPANLTAGEFVIPKEVVSWFGQKHMYGLIEKAHKDRAEAKQRTGAVPKVSALPLR